MSKLPPNTPNLRFIMYCCFTFALLLSPVANAQVDTSELRGKPFSDPAEILPMPAAWSSLPITYDKEVADADVSIVMDQDIYHTLLPLIKKYASDHKLKIAVKEGTCGIASGQLRKKKIDSGGFCCPPGKEDRMPGLKYHTLGIVANAILVHPDSPVESLSVDDLRDIYRGKINNWSQVKIENNASGPDRPIQAFGRTHCKKRPGHWYLILPDDKMFGPMIHEVGSIPDMISQVGSTPDSIGWEVLSMVEHYKHLTNVKPIKINGKHPTDKKALTSREYPFYRTYAVTTWVNKESANKNNEELVKHLLKEVENIDFKFGFVPANQLRAAGWKFHENELIGEPQ